MNYSFMSMPVKPETVKGTDYSQANIGNNPTVNLAIGRLQYVFQDVGIGTSNFAVSVAHIYSTRLNGKFATMISGLGKNWKLNLTQFVIADNYDSETGLPVLKYFDESGEIHRYVYYSTNKWYNERKATSTIEKVDGNYVLSDGVGNKLYFNANGYLVKSVSCQNSEIVKLYTYDSNNRLTSVYDQRTPKNHIDLTYNADGNLETMIAYASNTHPKSGCRYEYDAENNLVAVFQIAYGSNYQQIAEKQILQFYYANGNLVMVIDPESKGAKAVQYDSDGNVARLSTGIIKENCIESGMTDAAGKPVALGSGVTLGMSCEPDFVEKSFNTFSYRYNEPTDYIAVETEVTNECGITLRYYIDRNASISSSFERDKSFAKSGTNLKTLTKYAGQFAPSSGTSALGYINGCGTFTTSNGAFSALLNPNILVNNLARQIYSNFNYSFWLKTKKNYGMLEVKAVYKVNDSSDSNVYQRTVLVNPQAVGAWQLVIVPLAFQVPSTGNGPLYSLDISLLADKAVCRDQFEVNVIGLAPSALGELKLVTKDYGDMPLSNVQKVKITLGTGSSETLDIDGNFYLTESDVISTYTNKYRSANGVFDLICNNGAKRRTGVSDMQFYFASLGWATCTSSSKPFCLSSMMPVRSATIKTYYNYASDGFVIENNYSKTIDGTTYSSATSVKMDYKGNTLYEIDEYGNKKEYLYNADGSLKQFSVANGSAMQSLEKYEYDSEGNLVVVDNGFGKQKIFYDEAARVKKVVDAEEEGISEKKTVETGRFEKYSLGIFGDRTIGAAEYSDSMQVGSRHVTYENGQMRTISDGLVKYGVKHDLFGNETLYTQFDGATEKPIQRDSVSEYRQSGNSYHRMHASEFFGETGVVTDASYADIDAYGRMLRQAKGSTLSYLGGTVREFYEYVYPQIQESEFTNKPVECKGPDTVTTKEYKYDSDGNLVGWTDKEGTKAVFDVTQISANTTKYAFGSNEQKFFVEVNHDKDKTAAPHVESVVVQIDKNADVDRPEKLFTVKYKWNDFGVLSNAYTEKSVESYSYKTLKNNRLLGKIEYAANVVGVGGRSLETIDYYDNGLVKQQSLRHCLFNGTYEERIFNTERTFQYDNLRRITKEINTGLGINRTYSYYPDGRLKQIADSQNNEVKNFVYDSKGRLVSMGQNTYTYDNFGNRISKTENGVTKNYTYDVGGRLVSCGRVNYYYNADGIRCKKICVSNGIPEKMYLDGGKVIGEDRANYKLRYFYDESGLKRIRYIGSGYNVDYECVKDSNGSIIMLVNMVSGLVACQYEYDALGNCKIVYQENKIGEINPFKWKGFFHDSETGFYYANGSYYDPETGLYVDAAPVSTVFENANSTRHIDRNGTLCYNTLAIAGSPYTVSTTVELKEDLNYDPGKRWWERIFAPVITWWNNISNFTKVLCGTLLIVAALILAGLKGLSVVKILVDVCIGIGTAIAFWTIESAFSGEWNIDSLKRQLADAIFFTGVMVFVSTCISPAKEISRSDPAPEKSLAECAGNCFIAGTLVATSDGLKPIEDIEVGDKVLAYDPETGEQAYKPVVRLFRNTTDKWYHVHVNKQDITCTAEHPFYVADIDEFVPAKDLKAGQHVLLADGSCAVVDGILVEELNAPETTYNFEVEDYHTYYVSDDKVLVHNRCVNVVDDGFEEWLNSGAANNSVYKGMAGNEEVYTGITKQSLPQRLAQHQRNGKPFNKLVEVYKNLTRNQARAIETYLIQTDGMSQMNKILSISRKHRYYAQAMSWAKFMIGG